MNRIGQYQYSDHDSLGRGSFAEVFKGYRSGDNKPVAIKRIHKSRLKKVANRKLLESEIAILKEIKHPNVVELYGDIENDKFICLVMEYCDGGDLNDYIKANAPLSEKRIASMISQIAEALKHLLSKKNHPS